MKTKVVGRLDIEGRFEQMCRVYDTDYLSPTICASQGGGIMIREDAQEEFEVNTGRNAE